MVLICALVSGAMVAGCAALPGGGPAPVDAFDLSTPAVSTSGRRALRTQILVNEPAAIKTLDGQDIAIRTAGGAIQLLGGARWADRLPRIVQARLAEMLRRSGRFGGVGTPGEGLAIDYQLLSELGAFEIRVDGQDRAEVAILVRLLNDRTGVVRASRSFTASVPVTGSGGNAYAAALDRAFAVAVADLPGWILAHM